MRQIDLVYFEGCPHATEARANLRAAMEQLGFELRWSEWDVLAESTPEPFRRYGSPTVLVDGTDVAGTGHEVLAMACRAAGAPTIEAIARALITTQARRRGADGRLPAASTDDFDNPDAGGCGE